MNRARWSERFKLLAKQLLRSRHLSDAVRTVAAFRGRSLVLVYHRVVASEPPPLGIVPSVPSSLFRQQLEALQEMGEIVPLGTLVRYGDRRARPMFALTFDDDFVTHLDLALPILQAFDVPATFFLSGRALHGLGSYWFERLERLIADRGVRDVGRLLDMPGAELDDVIDACERDPTLQRVVETEAAGDSAGLLRRRDLEALSAAGMTVGFHTVHHQTLTRLGNFELDAALTVGRRELEDVVGRPLVQFAYPHGKADARTAAGVRDAGFEAGWTGRPQAITRREDPYLLGRWEPGAIEIDEFVVGTAIRLSAR